MRKFFLFSLSLATLSLTACDEVFKGALSLSSETSLTNTKNKTVVLPAGVYEAQFRAESEDLVELRLKSGSKTHKIPFHLPENFEIPSKSGRFTLPGSESGQPVDLQGEVESVTTESESYRGYESCSYSDYEEICERWVDSNGRVHYRCYCQYRTRSDGEQRVEYYFIHTDKSITAQISRAGTEDALGEFAGDYRESDKVYTYTGECRARFRDRCSR